LAVTAAVNPGQITLQCEQRPHGGKCGKCGIIRPVRSHHCSTCKTCTRRLDHHCAWVNNCIGLRNHKPFLLYKLYLAIAGLFHFYLSFDYIFGHDGHHNPKPDYIGGPTIWKLFYVHNAIVVMFTLFVIGLVFNHGLLMVNNVTTLE
jgi:palmitoyltransferase